MVLRITSSTLFLAVALFSAAQGQQAPQNVPARAEAEKQVLNAEHEWVRVTLKGDADAFASFLAEDYMELKPSGRFVDKATWTQAIRAGTTHYETVELRDLKVRFPRPDVAVVTGAFSQTGVAGGRDNSGDGVYINTWVWIDGRWRLVSSGFAPRPSPTKS